MEIVTLDFRHKLHVPRDDIWQDWYCCKLLLLRPRIMQGPEGEPTVCRRTCIWPFGQGKEVQVQMQVKVQGRSAGGSFLRYYVSYLCGWLGS